MLPRQVLVCWQLNIHQSYGPKLPQNNQRFRTWCRLQGETPNVLEPLSQQLTDGSVVHPWVNSWLLRGSNMVTYYSHSYHHLWTIRVDLRCDGHSSLWLLKPIFEHKTRVNKMANLYFYLRFCGSIMYTAGLSSTLWLTEATGINVNGYNMLDNGNFALFWTTGGVVDPHRDTTKSWLFWDYGNFGDKNTLFLDCWAVRGAIAFARHLDLTLTHNKTNEGVKKQWNTQCHDKSWHIVTCLAVFSDYEYFYWCIGGYRRRERESGREGLDGCLILLTLLTDPKLDCQKLWHWLGECFWVDNSWFTKGLHHTYLKK